MQCERCRQDNPAPARFCMKCGGGLGLSCARCRTELPAGAAFCFACGQSVTSPTAEPRFASPEAYTPKHLVEKILTSRSAVEGERKQVSVLVADLRGSLELLAERDPEEARKLVDPVMERMIEAVHRYEGAVNQVMGDGLMAIFGAPLAHEDHAVRACYAALRMQEAVANEYLSQMFGEDKAIQLVLDRRRGERRQVVQPHFPERRVAARRRPAAMDEALASRGLVVTRSASG
jgi:Adenylate and Guanylate cyclase catalytic domain/Double zinc ribbon